MKWQQQQLENIFNFWFVFESFLETLEQENFFIE